MPLALRRIGSGQAHIWRALGQLPGPPLVKSPLTQQRLPIRSTWTNSHVGQAPRFDVGGTHCLINLARVSSFLPRRGPTARTFKSVFALFSITSIFFSPESLDLVCYLQIGKRSCAPLARPQQLLSADPLDTKVESRHEGTFDVPKVISTSSRPVAPLTFKATARILAGILAVSPKTNGLDGGDRQDRGGMEC